MSEKEKVVTTEAPTAIAPNNGEISLPSFRDGIPLKVRPLNFGGFKAIGRAEAANVISVDIMSIMIFETLKREFPNVTEKEIDALEMDDLMKLSDIVTAFNEDMGVKKDFTPPTSTGS